MKSLFEFNYSLPILGLASLLLCPVLQGCESLHCKGGDFTAAETVPVKMAVHSSCSLKGQVLDVLVFHDDMLKHMECWQRAQPGDENEMTLATTNGDKILMACTGPDRKNHEGWMWVSTLASLSDAWTELEDEITDMPVMSGSCTFKAGSSLEEQPELMLRRVSAEIYLRSLRCDFKGRPYEGAKLSEIHVYLTNVNASCRIWNNDAPTSRIINQGQLTMTDVSRFKDRSLIWQKIEGEVDETGISPEIRLRCYPNPATEEGPGSQFTRLVIQGKLDGDIWYWPIDINAGKDRTERGIEANRIYAYDIVLTRKGSADPDTGIRTENASITMEVEKWDEKEEYTVIY